MSSSGTRNGYWWYEGQTLPFCRLLDECRPYFDSRYIAVAACDSGPLIPTESERVLGWTFINDVLFVPPSTGIPPLGDWRRAAHKFPPESAGGRRCAASAADWWAAVPGAAAWPLDSGGWLRSAVPLQLMILA